MWTTHQRSAKQEPIQHGQPGNVDREADLPPRLWFLLYLTFLPFFGSVKDIVIGADPVDDKINVHWITIRNSTVRFVDVQSATIPYKPENTYLDHYVAMPPTRMEDLKVPARHTSDDLSLVNDFVSAIVNNHFYFNVSGGWVKKA